MDEQVNAAPISQGSAKSNPTWKRHNYIFTGTLTIWAQERQRQQQQLQRRQPPQQQQQQPPQHKRQQQLDHAQ